MTRRLNVGSPTVVEPLGRLLESAVAGGAPAPEWIAFEGPDHPWWPEVCRMPRKARGRGVVAVSSIAGAAAAARLEVGGAIWLPASVITVAQACAAAARPAVRCPVVDLEVAEAVAALAGTACVVRVQAVEFWLRQWGARRLENWLQAVADVHRQPAVVLPGPGLLMGDGQPDGLLETAESVALEAASSPVPRFEVSSGEVCRVSDAMAWVMADRDGVEGEAEDWGPVFELPSGRYVGSWSPDGRGDPPATGWRAVPRSVERLGHCWQVRWREGEAETLVDVLDQRSEDDRDGGAVVRVPGWLSSDLGPGRPASILVERLARRAIRRGIPVWVPGVAAADLQFLLRTGARLWIDGPAVPRSIPGEGD